jgi:hypothetical protein
MNQSKRWDIGWSPFWTIAGRGIYWPGLVTVWHVEPGGHDSGEVCKHYTRSRDSDGKWNGRMLHGWRWHVHHWHLQIHPLQQLRRWALTRCAWCHGRHTRRDPVNVSHSWNGSRGHWWQGEHGLYHHDCSAISGAHRQCLCPDAVLDSETGGYIYGNCARCGKFRAWRNGPDELPRLRILAAIPAGQRDPKTYGQFVELAKAATTPAGGGEIHGR